MCGVLVALSLVGLSMAPPARTDAPLDTYDNAWIAVGPVRVDAGEAVQSIVAVGPVTVAGSVFGDVTTIGGRVTVEPTGLVTGQVTAICASVEVQEGAKVLGDVRQQELPLVRATPLTPDRPSAAELILGDREFVEPHLRHAIVIGGSALVRATSGLTDIIAIGGDLRIEDGSQVKAARAFGGQFTRVITHADDQDECAEPLLLRVGGRTAAERAAVAYLTSSFEADKGSVKLAASSDTPSTGEVHMAAFAPGARVELTLAAKQAARSPLPVGKQLGAGRDYGQGWASWPRQYLWVPTDTDPLLQKSSAVGVGVRVDVTIESADAPRLNVAQRSITLGVPADAEGLLSGPGARQGGGRY